MQFHAISSTVHSVKKDVESIYGKYAPFQFLAYWYVIRILFDFHFHAPFFISNTPNDLLFDFLLGLSCGTIMRNYLGRLVKCSHLIID